MNLNLDALARIGLQALLLAGIVWAVTSAGRRWISPAWRAAMWFLVIARLLIPVAPPSAFSLQNLFRQERTEIAQPVSESVATVVLMERSSVSPAPAAVVSPAPIAAKPAPFDVTRVLVWTWLSVAGLAVLALAGRAIVLRRRLRAGAPEEAVEAFESARAELRVRYPVRLAVSDEVAAPALTGFLPARLIVPATQNYSTAELRQIFLHELAHVKLGHLFFHWVALVARAVHWFNPVAHFAAARMRQECELAADQFALARLSENEKPTYGETILRAVRGGHSSLAIAMADDARHLKRRLRALNEAARPKAFLGFALLVLLTACGMTGAKPSVENAPQAKPAEAAEPLFTKTFRVGNPRSFHERVEEELRTLMLHPEPVHTGLPSSHEPAQLVALLFSHRIKEPILESRFRSGQEGFFYNDRTGIIFARATQARLDKFESELKRTIGIGYSVLPAEPPNWNPYSRTNGVGKGAEAILRKLETLTVDASKFREPMALEDVLKRLSQETNRINFIMAASPNSVSPEHFKITFASPQGRVSLLEFLDRVVAGASPPPDASRSAQLGYSIEEYAVVFSVRDPGQQVSRVIKIPDDAGDADAVSAMIKDAATVAVKAWRGQGQPGIMWNFDRAERTVLMKATTEVVDRFENELMQRTSKAAPKPISGREARISVESNQQIKFETRIVEAPEEQTQKLLDELATAQGIKATNQLFVAGLNRGAAAKDLPTPAGKGMFEKVAEPIAYSNVVVDGLQGILDRQSRDRFLARSEAAGGKIVSAPSVLTLLGRQARISISESKTAVTAAGGKLRSNILEFGPTVDVFPARFDGEHIHFVAAVDISEFLGYADNKDERPLPRVRIRSVSSDVKIRPGMTQVLSYPATEVDVSPPVEVASAFNSPLLKVNVPSEPARRRVFILITPILVNDRGEVMFPEKHAQ